MSWSIEEHIGECRPWPAQVVIYRGETDECLAYVSGEVADQLKAENAKLRELASILCFCMQVHAQCDDCKLNGAKGELAHDPLCACDGLHEILRELGIEADE